ncbi:MAG: IS1634 family transposase, partial [Flavobacteriaceae bacterium]|nr:IS1634 family transposase [Flavobacteriaceae bacterium]
ICKVFVRKKKNKSGVISIQIIDKSTGKYRVLKTIGSSTNKSEIDQLYEDGKQWIKNHTGIQELDFTDYRYHTELVLDGLEEISVRGPELLLGKLFDQVGFNQLNDDLFKQLVLARLCYPSSKLKTSDYLFKYQNKVIDVQSIYRYMDKLHKQQKSQIQEISYKYTLKILDGAINVVFYDVTTIYFEIDNEDDLRKTGFSKEGKHQNPQIVLGLLVSKGGYPLAYDIFEGNKFEGHTMLPIIDHFKQKFKLDQLVIVADSGLLSFKNIEELQRKGYEFILGARIKNEKTLVKEKILALKLKNGESTIVEKDDLKLIISYSDSRAKKDKHNREKGLKRLEKKVKSGKLTKSSINNRGYNKYLKVDGELKVSIDKTKFETDANWDGLKGYITNAKLSKNEILQNYSHLWKIEKAFRIAKTDLKIRPIYHRVQRRIEAHICIAFVAYKIYKELERQLKEKKSTLSPEKAINIAKTIYAVKIKHPITKETTYLTHIKTEEQKNLANLFNF